MKRLGNNSKRTVSTHGAAKALLRMGGVLAVAVGLFATGPAQAGELIKCAYPYGFGFAPTMVAEIVDAQAIGGLMEPEDMAAIYLFLASEAADNITGQALTVDRGEIMQ